MDKVFAIGDVHGKLNMLNNLLKQWNPDNQQLILLGDLIDRGEDSYGVVHLARQLKEKYGAIVLKGNHEELLLSWLDTPLSESGLYYPQGGMQTINSFFESNITFTHMPDYIAKLMKTQFPDEITYLKELPYYVEWGDYVFVHGGVDLSIPNWKDTKESDFAWIRREFHYGENHTGKIFIFGHTPTYKLNPDKSSDIWLSPCQSKIGLDGGAVFGRSLHGMLIDTEFNEHTVFSLDKELNLQQKNIQLNIAV